MHTDQARAVVVRAVTQIVPDADFTGLPDDADLRRTFELDSLDFLGFVELLSQASGVRIDEEDYPELATLASCEQFLRDRTS
jgi:acyl carrier protein